jgi:hypothetical protein
MVTPQTPRAPRSPLARYAPLIAVVVVIAIVAVVIGVVHDNKKSKSSPVTANTNAKGQSNFSDVPIFYNEAKKAGTTAKYTWPSCDTSTGTIAIPTLLPPPCTPAASGASAPNGGATSRGVTANTIKVGYFSAKPDPTVDALLKAAGAYDAPTASAQAYKDYTAIYQGVYNLYGRKVQLVKINGTGSSTDEVAAKADADQAAAEGVFAVMGGPGQAQSFEAELARKHILCIASCVSAAPASTLAQDAPYLWSAGPTPEQTALMTTELIKTQLVGKDAVYGGPAVKSKPRAFALLSYDTPDGVYKAPWDQFYKDLQAAGAPTVGHVSYFLNLASLASDARTIATKLKSTGATTIVFTGDPIFPEYLTKAMTEQNYFPEWVMAGTVLADTNVFARTFDQQQWQHAFGLQLIPARLPKAQQDAYTLHQWWFGTPPPTQNNYAIVNGDVALLMAGLQLAGPNLTADTFRDGLFHAAPKAAGPTLQTIVTWGNHGYWQGTDYGGLDNAGVLYWDPTAVGADETGKVGNGMYRLVDGGTRYLPGQWPTAPIKLFDPAGTVTVYPANQIPAELLPKPQPVPADAPAATKK